MRAALEETKARVAVLKAQLAGSIALPTVLQLADTLDFPVIDNPLDDAKPSGGTRPASTIAGSAAVSGLALVGLLVLFRTLVAGDTGRENAAGSTPARESQAPGPFGPAPSSNTPVVDPNVASSADPSIVAARPNTLAT